MEITDKLIEHLEALAHIELGSEERADCRARHSNRTRRFVTPARRRTAASLSRKQWNEVRHGRYN